MSAQHPDQKEKVCELCNEKPSKYCCPRCELLYCSLDCYKSETHSECSENFYRECVNSELAANYTDEDAQKKMLDILKRLNNTDDSIKYPIEDTSDVDSDDNDEPDIHERMKDLNLDDADAIWDALTEDEKNEFQAILNGQIDSILPRWEPWWTYKIENKLVDEIDSKEDDEVLIKCPKVKETAMLSNLTTVQPSPTIKFNITNVIASYVFLMRYFNGEVDAVEFALYLLNICANLDSNANFEDLPTAVESVAQKCLQSELIETDDISLNVMKEDTYLILEGPSKQNKYLYCESSLSHVHSIFCEAKSTQKGTKSERKSDFSKKFPEGKLYLPKLDSSKVKRCIKKVEYYLAYVHSHGIDMDYAK